MVSSCRQLFCILWAREEKLGAAASLLRIINSARAVLWDICFLYSLAGRDIKARGLLLPRARVLPVTRSCPPARCLQPAPLRLPLISGIWLWSTSVSNKKNVSSQSGSHRDRLAVSEAERSAYPHPYPQSIAEVPCNWNHMCLGWGWRRLLSKSKEQSGMLPSFQMVTWSLWNWNHCAARKRAWREEKAAALHKAEPLIVRGLQGQSKKCRRGKSLAGDTQTLT